MTVMISAQIVFILFTATAIILVKELLTELITPTFTFIITIMIIIEIPQKERKQDKAILLSQQTDEDQFSAQMETVTQSADRRLPATCI